MAASLGRRYDGLGLVQHSPHGPPASLVPHGGVFQFTIDTDDRSFAVNLDIFLTQKINQLPGQQRAQ